MKRKRRQPSPVKPDVITATAIARRIAAAEAFRRQSLMCRACTTKECSRCPAIMLLSPHVNAN